MVFFVGYSKFLKVHLVGHQIGKISAKSLERTNRHTYILHTDRHFFVVVFWGSTQFYKGHETWRSIKKIQGKKNH